jgi:hypothetical protein
MIRGEDKKGGESLWHCWGEGKEGVRRGRGEGKAAEKRPKIKISNTLLLRQIDD